MTIKPVFYENNLPEYFPLPEDGMEGWVISHTSEDFQKNFNEKKSIIEKLVHHEPCSLYQLNSACNLLTSWFRQASTQHSLTFPFTQEGLVQALHFEFLQQPNDVLFFLANLFPQSTMKALQSLPNPPEEWKDVLLSVPSQSLKKEIQKDQSSNHPKLPDSKLSESKPLEKKKEKYIPPVVTENSHKVRQWLKEVNSSDAPLVVRKEEWSGKIKKDIIASKGIGQDANNYWFEDFFTHALCGLSKSELAQVKELWPDHNRPTLHNPVSFMKNVSLWKSLGSMSKENRTFLVESVFPSLIDRNSWTFKERYEMLQNMLEAAKERKWLFPERILFWQSLGGDLNEAGFSGDENDLLSPQSPLTALQWIKDQKINEWDEDIEDNKSKVLELSHPENQSKTLKVTWK